MMKKSSSPRKRVRRANQVKNSTHEKKLMDSWQLTQALTCELLDRLHSKIDTLNNDDESWDLLFGSKDSAVLNLQKLVVVLGQISDRLNASIPDDVENHSVQTSAMSHDDMLMLHRWLQEEIAQQIDV